MVAGIGVDIVDVERFKGMVRRSPGVVDKLFTPDERIDTAGRSRSAESLAARFAAKEAVAKALGCPPGLNWHDCEVVTLEHGGPGIVATGTVLAAAESKGISGWHLSLSHDGGVAVAYVIAE